MPEFRTLKALFFLALLIFTAKTSQGQAYCPLFKEPFHHLVFENEEFRVLHVIAEQGDTTDYHEHLNPICYISLKETKVALNEVNDHWVHSTIPKGWIGHDIYKKDSSFVHRFTLTGRSPMEIIAIEFKNNTSAHNLKIKPEYSAEGISIYKFDEQESLDTLDPIPILKISPPKSPDDSHKITVGNAAAMSRKSPGEIYFAFTYRGFSQSEVGK